MGVAGEGNGCFLFTSTENGFVGVVINERTGMCFVINERVLLTIEKTMKLMWDQLWLSPREISMPM